MNTLYTEWYKSPAVEWYEALPLGCGSRGAMVRGGYDKEDILLNQDTFWAGLPILNDFKENRKYIPIARDLIDEGKYSEAHKFVEEYMVGSKIEPYLPLGHMKINFHNEKVSDYIRALDLSNALYSCDYTCGTAKYHREGFLSHVHTVFAQKFTAEDGFLNFTLNLESDVHSNSFCDDGFLKLMGRAPIHSAPEGTTSFGTLYDLTEEGDCNKFQVWVFVDTDGTKVFNNNDITIKDATWAYIYQTSDTSFIDWKSMPRKNPAVECERLIGRAINDGYDKMKTEHIADYKNLFDRVKFILDGNGNSVLPTDERISKFAYDMSDNELCALYFNFGRYLMISCERRGSMPGNLQGIWSWKEKAEWGSDLHTNINLQMNYWCAENTNLSECHFSLLEWLRTYAESGRKTAASIHGCRGFCTYHITDLWNKTTPSEGDPEWAYWPMGGAWLAMDIFDHYEYTKDINFLAEYFDILKDATLFLYDWLYFDNETGYYLTSPSTSPENKFKYIDANGEVAKAAVSKGSTNELTITREIFSDFIKASEILGRDEDFAASVLQKLDLIYPYNIGTNGQLQEWFKDFEENEMGHRHMSHMISLYPGNFINEESTPDLFSAVQKSLEIRLNNGSGNTGWSCAWAMIFLAKFRESERICSYIQRLFKDSTCPNLLDLHPPHIFQIDGNFGTTAAFGEMLLQNNSGVIEILPCVPDIFKNGKMYGLRAKGAVTVNLEWENFILKNAEIIPDFDGEYTVRYKNKTKTFNAKAGVVVTF